MSKIPEKSRKEVLDRSDGKCELCGNHGANIHHIVFRRHNNHSPEALILLCFNCHEKAHKAGTLDGSLKKLLQTYYLDKHDEEEVRELMGGRLYDNWIVDRGVLGHLRVLRRRYEGR